MKPNTLTYIFCILLVFIFNSCRHVYFPSSPNIPLFYDGGEVKATVKLGSDGSGGKFSYSPINHIGIISNFSYLNNLDSVDQKNYSLSYSYEFGGGFYHKIFDSLLTVENYFGYGEGRGIRELQVIYPYITSSSRTRYNKYFHQVNLGISNKLIDVGLSLKTIYLNLHDAFSDGVHITSEGKMNTLLIEPSVVSRAGWKFIKTYTQIGLSIPLKKPLYDNIYNNLFTLEVGLQITLFKEY